MIPIFCDIDGCISQNRKLWTENGKQFYKSKALSDQDAYIINKLGNQIVLISGDREVNAAWAKRRDANFIFTAAEQVHGDKWKFLQDYWKRHILDGTEPQDNYIYIGDSMPDLNCMINAKIAYMPNDASLVLQYALNDVGVDAIVLDANGGEGVLDEVIVDLVYKELLSWEDLKKKFGIG